MSKTKEVKLRLPPATIRHIERVAKLANVTPTQVYNVILALTVLQRRGDEQ